MALDASSATAATPAPACSASPGVISRQPPSPPPASASTGRLSGAGVAAVALLASSALFLGQGWRLQALARTAEAQSAAVRAAAPRPGPADQLAARRLAAFRQLSARPNGLAALSVALGVLKLYGAEPTGLAVDSSSLTLTLPYSAIDKVDRIALELEDSGAFSDVRPITDARGKTIALQMKLGRAGAQAPAPVSPGG